jgi:hypothetical protein
VDLSNLSDLSVAELKYGLAIYGIYDFRSFFEKEDLRVRLLMARADARADAEHAARSEEQERLDAEYATGSRTKSTTQ